MSTIPVEEIPTVSLLYHLKKLVPALIDPEDESPVLSRSFNDRICVVCTDITKLEVDAIVNAANNSLLGGGGVDGAIHRAAGPKLLRATRKLDGCDTGSAKITEAFELPCKKVIHAVGPVYYFSLQEKCARELATCYITSLELAVQNDCKTVAFSAISTGVYGYPSHIAARIAIKTVKKFLEGENGDKLEKVVFCTFMQKDVDAYNYWLPRFFPPTKPKTVEQEPTAKESTEQEPTEQESTDQNLAEQQSFEPKPSKPEPESDWEEVEASGSAANGLVAKEADYNSVEKIPKTASGVC